MNGMPSGSAADIRGKVEIGKVIGGYFSDLRNVQKFIELGLMPIEKDLPQNVSYADLGGGEGALAKGIQDYLQGKGHITTTTVIDANETYLERARGIGLHTLVGSISDIANISLDLATMRSVLHYNSKDEQLNILKKTRSILNTGGYFINQFSSGSALNCELRLRIVNSLSLGRAKGSESYHWLPVEEAVKLYELAGFSSIQIAGYAFPAAWGPEEQFDRFHGHDLETALKNNDAPSIKRITEQKIIYVRESNMLLEQYLQKHGPEQTGIEKKPGGKYTISYIYPIIIARK